jgi:hypothetical protein
MGVKAELGGPAEPEVISRFEIVPVLIVYLNITRKGVGGMAADRGLTSPGRPLEGARFLMD